MRALSSGSPPSVWPISICRRPRLSCKRRNAAGITAAARRRPAAAGRACPVRPARTAQPSR
eukprot:scaffold1535_cov79-Isochrysis_galbana.AAC.1